MFKSKPEKVRREIKFAIKTDEFIRKTNKIWPLTNLDQVFKRRFLLMHQGLEIFTRDKKSYYFNLLTGDSAATFFNSFKPIVVRHNK